MLLRIKNAYMVLIGKAKIESVYFMPPYQVKYRLGKLYGLSFGLMIGREYEAEYLRCLETTYDIISDEYTKKAERKKALFVSYRLGEMAGEE
jgi:hypothetical protein